MKKRATGELNEGKLLENTLALAEAEGYGSAYAYLLAHMDGLPEGDSPQIRYFLVCLAAGSGQPQMALKHLSEALAERGYWYRPEIWEDGDLAAIADLPDFGELVHRSNQRYEQACKLASPLSTFQRWEKPELLLCLHGNGQNEDIARRDWEALASERLQIEALCSGTPDCIGRFRWTNDDENDSFGRDAIGRILTDGPGHLALAGFSAGCNQILRILTLTELTVPVILLQSPWIPFFVENRQRVTEALTEKNVQAHIFCGQKDEDCLPHAQALFEALKDQGACLTTFDGLRHEFPDVLTEEYVPFNEK